jgi:hypothetical protein
MKKLLVVPIALAIIGCAAPETFRVTCVIPETTVIVYGSKYKTGYATKYLIHMSGEKVNERVRPYPEVLYDEFMHTLGIACPSIFMDNNEKHKIN